MTHKTVDLPLRSCQYHGGRTDENGFLVFCGKPVVSGSSYCAEHYWRIYQRAPTIGAARPAVTEAEEAAPSALESAELVQEAA